MVRAIFKISALAIVYTYLNCISYAITNEKSIKEIDIEEKLGKFIPLNLKFINEKGEMVTLSRYFNEGKPIMLNLAYFNCSRLCTFTIKGVVDVVNEMKSLVIGRDYKILTISFAPDEDFKLAAKNARRYRNLTSASSEDWAFLTSRNEEAIAKITEAVGFKYKRDGKEYAHPSSLIILAPNGKISRYLYGIDYNVKDVKLALLEASKGKIGSWQSLNRVLLFCYGFDPVGKKYALKALNVVKAGGIVTLLALGLLLATMWKREKSHGG